MHLTLVYLFLGLASLPFIYYLLAIYSSRRFFSRREIEPSSFTPPLSILKPVRGLDPDAYKNFASFCDQDYPEYEILFCVNDLNDEAVPLIRRIIEEFPERSIRLLSGAPQPG